MFTKHFLEGCCGLLLGIFACTVQAAPDILHWTTPNGARVYFVPSPELPMLDVRVEFDAGSARDGKLAGLANLSNHMLGLGSNGLSATKMAQRFEGVGANFTRGAEADMAWVQVRSLVEPKWMDIALDSLTLVLTRPNFAAEDFERERKRVLTSIESEKQDPGDIASRAFYKAVYGDHPYGHMTKGTEEGVNALKREDLLQFYKKYYVAKNAVVAITGQVTRKQAEAIAARLVDKLPTGEKAPPLPPVPELTEAKTIRIDYPSTQTHVLIGQPGMYRGDPDYFALYVGNHALGGSGLVSRLSDEVREKRGLSYSVYSYFLPMARKGPFIMGMQTRNDQLDEGLKIMWKTLRDYLDKGMTQEELVDSRKNITGGFPLRIDSNSKILEYIAMIGFYNLPLTYLDDFNKNVETPTLERIRQAMRTRLHPDKMVTVIVGGGH